MGKEATLKNLLGHFRTVTRHKWEVMKACFRAGLFLQGITHDMSKFSPTEFLISARYYQGGKSSPVFAERRDKGYSLVEQHHHGHNPHHWEYWINLNFHGTPIQIPVKYIREMVCDHIGAGRVYRKGEWTPRMPLEHTKHAFQRNVWLLHPASKELLLRLEEDFANMGFAAIRAKHVQAVVAELAYDSQEAINYEGDNITTLELDFRGENQPKT
jgi:hypothetical protein